MCSSDLYAGTRKRATKVAGLPASLRGKPILIVDTIYDTGRTIARVARQARLLSSIVWLAVLVEKLGKAAVPAGQQAARVFTGLHIAGDPFLIGYGLDVSGEHRSLPDIRKYVREDVREDVEGGKTSRTRAARAQRKRGRR